MANSSKTESVLNRILVNGLYLKDQLQNIWADLSSDRQELDRVLQRLPNIQSNLLSKKSEFLQADYSISDPFASYPVTYSIFEGYFTQLYSAQVQLLPNPVTYFDLSPRKSPPYFFLVSNFIQAFLTYDSSSAISLEKQYEEFVSDYFGAFLYYMIGYGSGLVILAAVLLVVLVLSLIHFNGILENIFFCQPHEILEKKKAIQKVVSLCQLHRHDNYYFLGTLKDHDLETISIESKGLNKFTAQKSKGLHFFGLLRAYIPEIIAIVVLIVLLVAAALDYNTKYKLFSRYSNQMTVIVKTMKLQIEMWMIID